MRKRFRVAGEFPSGYPAHMHYQRTEVEAITFATAAHRGLKELLSRKGIRAKGHKTITVTITLLGKVDNDDEQVQRDAAIAHGLPA